MPDINQDRIISMAAGFQYSKILLTANELGIFKAVGDKSKTPAQVSGALKLDPEATDMLMRALVGLGLMTYKAGRFTNAPDVQKYLTGDGDDGLACITRHMNHLYSRWSDLDDIMKKGRTKRRAPSKLLTDRKQNRDFICGMFEIGYDTAKAVADAVDMTGVAKMADIGGGPAQYPLALSRKNPDTKFVLADYPNTVKVAREYVSKYGLKDRVKLVNCEFFDVKELGIGNDYDLALLSQVLHAVSDDKCKELIGKVYRILKAGGRILINENAMDDDKAGPPPPLIFAINMLINTAGRTFTTGELAAWLRQAGFKSVKVKRLHQRSALIEGRK